MDKSKLARERITRERVRLIIHRPFFGVLASGLILVEDKNRETVATDGEFLFYNPDFVNALHPDVLRTIIAHEVLHCALGHLWRRGDRTEMRWNIAADHAANLILKKDGFSVPQRMYCDERFSGMSAEEIYLLIPDAKEEGKQFFDSHDEWKGKRKPSDKDSEGEKQEDKPSENPIPDTSSDAPAKGEEKGDEKEWKERMVRAAHAARMQGKLPGHIEQLIWDVFQPKLDWRAILRDLIILCAKNDFRLYPPSKKHLWREIYLPSVTGETLEIAVAIDSSDSILEEEFRAFISEVRNIAEQFEDYIIHLFICDAAIHHRATLSREDFFPEAFPKRGGGTDFRPVFSAIEEDELSVSALIYLTDGKGTYPEYEPEYPVIWVINQECEPPWGEIVNIDIAGE